ncbi:MAG TPA: hypothetical protein VJA21_05000 [Verrucomicrobiae bacterium]
MAWRIHDSVIRGEVDNRQRGKVRGQIWLEGYSRPIVLQLKGNAAPDLAGCLLTFENPGKRFPMPKDAELASVQLGTIGDLTASRKVRVLDMPVGEAYARKKQGLDVPEHMANCLYLEWYSEANGRVVVESTEYTLTISPPAWRLSPEEETDRQNESAKGFAGFLQRLSDALETKKHQPPEDKEWDEFDYEKFMRECDARTDKYGELLDKYMDHPDRDRIIAREMGWTTLEEALEAEEMDKEDRPADKQAEAPDALNFEPGEEETDQHALEVPDDIPEPVPDPATEGIDWVRKEDGHVSHPLALRAFEDGAAFWHKLKELGLEKLEDEDLGDLLHEYRTTSAKLAGALNSLAYGRHLTQGPFVVACLKRALGHLHAAQAALEKVVDKKLLPTETTSGLRGEFFALREDVLKLMEEFRGIT